MHVRLSSLGDAQFPRYCSNMVRIMLTSPWIGIGLTILCLGTSGGCRCVARTRKPPIPSAICVDRLPRCPTLCGPCNGYHPTCWMAWPDGCGTCPPPEQIVPVPRGPVGDALPGEGVRSNAKDLEVVPMPQEEPPKAKEPLPKVKEPPQARPPQPKAEKPQSIVPIKPSVNDSESNDSDTADWDTAPLPAHHAERSLPDTMSIHSDRGVGAFAPTRDIYDMCLALVAPATKNIFPEVCQAIFRQEKNGSSDR